MTIAIYGAGEFGRYVYEELSKAKNSKITLTAWIENKKNNETFLGLPVWTEKIFLEKCSYVDAVVVAIQNIALAQEVTLSLLESGYTDVYILTKDFFEAKLPILEDTGGVNAYVLKWSNILPVLPYLEYQVADHCNLRCKGCMHFSNLVMEPRYPQINEFEVVLMKLSKKFSSITKFRLMGGEPLLNPELQEYVKLVRIYFPSADIRVVTNGLMLMNVSDELLNAMKMCKASFDISQYAPTRQRIFQIIDFLKRHCVEYFVGEPIEKFRVRASYGEENYTKVFYESCVSKECTFLRDGRLYVCPHIPMLYEHKDFFKVEISESEKYRNSIDLLHGTENGWDILKRLKKPFSLCRYCSLNCREIPWETGTAEASDWFV